LYCQTKSNRLASLGYQIRFALARHLCSIEGVACALLAGWLFWKGVLPGWRILHTDFPNYYLVARLLREGYSLDRIYDWLWLQRIKDHWGIDQSLVGFAGLTPFSALPILPLSLLSALNAKRLWIVANLLFLGASVEVLHRTTTLGRRRVWLLCLACFFPLRTNFLLGQMHLLVLALLVFAYALNRKQKHVACGVCLGIAGMLKIYPLLLAAYFVWKRQWRALLAMCCATGFLVGIGTIAVGPGIVHTYFTDVLPRSLVGEVLDPYSSQSNSMAALFHKLFIYEPQLNPAPVSNSPLLYSIFYPVWQAAVLAPLFMFVDAEERGGDREQLHWAAWVFALLLLSPVPASYHFVVMALSVVLLMDFLGKRGEIGLIGVALLLYTMMSLVDLLPRRLVASGNIALGFLRLWIAIGFWMLLLFCLWRDRRKGRVWWSRPRFGLICVAVLAFWAVGALGNYRHFAHLGEETQRRILHMPPAYLSTGLRKTGRGYVFVAMGAQRYEVLDQAGESIGREEDELSAAATEGSPVVMVEIATRGGSQLIATPLDSGSGQTIALMQDAESPAFSPDGMTLAFIREVRGRGSLWIVSLQSPLGPPSGSPVQLTDAGYDVRNFALTPSGRIVFAAKVGDHTALFQWMPGRSPREFVQDLVDVDSPAVSPDEQLIAFTRRVHNRWQLQYVNSQTGAKQTLTNGDCNAYSPEWMDAHQLTYATDCGRGLGLTALATVLIGEPPARVANR
jgi:Glycosyltransferase family 87/WD40-like Beta Propeller Repeat